MKSNKVFMLVLGLVIATGFFGIIALLVFKAVPEPNSQVLYMLLGQLAAAFIMVVGYFFGSSKGSADKTELLAKNGTAQIP